MSNAQSSPAAIGPMSVDPALATFVAKWPGVRGGFQPVPNALLLKQHVLGLTPIELILLLNITLHRFATDQLSFPSTSQIAKRIGVTRRHVNAMIQSLEKRGFVKRLPKQLTPSGVRQPFDIEGLVEKVRPLIAWEREDQKARGKSAFRSVAHAQEPQS